MADTFEDLGIAPELASGASALGWDAPSALQRDAVPVIRRGNNVVLHASAGAGAVGAWGLGLLDRLLGEGRDDRPRALVLVPDAHAASRTAASLARLAAPAGLSVRALAVGWADRPVDVLVATAAAAVARVRDSALKLDTLAALVLDGADQLQATGQWASTETLAESAPATAQKIVVAGRFDGPLDGFLERHVRKALTVPPRPVEDDETSASSGTVQFAVAAEPDKESAILQLLEPLEAPEVAVVCRTPGRARELAAALAARGLPVDGPEEPGGAATDARVRVLPRLEADQRSTRADVVSYDVPFDPDALAALHGRGGAIVVTPREIAHLRRIARRAGFKLRPVPLSADAPLTRAEVVRDRLRDALEREDLSADLALVEPLLRDYPAEEIAAAALRLARGEAPATGAGETTGAAGEPRTAARAAAAATPSMGGAGAPPPSTQWVRLFVSAGSRDGLGPGDLVGAITGETGLEGGQVGKIEVRESHSTVEVPGELAAGVIQALNGRSLRGRSLRVDYDRKGRPGAGGRAAPGGRSGGGRPGGGRAGGARPGGRGAGGTRRPGGRGSGGRG